MAKKQTAPKRRKPAKRPVLARKKAKLRRVARGRRRAPVKRKAKAKARRRPARRAAKRVSARPATKVRRSKPGARPARRHPAPPRKIAAQPVRLERERRRLSDVERLDSSKTMTDSRMISAARAGHEDLKAQLLQHTETSPTLTAGDVDAKWQDAYAVGDEAPGGDNPTPEQDRVDDIGKALGVEYQDNEELQGGDEITERDEHRWELDPASSDDWPHKDTEEH
jgi:hypothetical protein